MAIILSLLLMLISLGIIVSILVISRNNKNIKTLIDNNPAKIARLQRNLKNMGVATDRATISWEDFQKAINNIIEAKE